MPDYLRVKNWDTFQHYKDRNPPWIKLHFEILSSQDWVNLSDQSKLLAVVCMLIASRNEGCVPNDPHYMRRVAYLDKVPDFKPLIKCGFLENLQAEASGSKRKQAEARPETETETETYSKETEERESSASRSLKGSRLSSDWSLPQGWGEWAEQYLPGKTIEAEGEKFKDYWIAQPGAKGVKLDWQATWRNWIRRKVEAA